MIDATSDKERLRTLVATNFYIPAGQKLEEGTSFLQQGIIDSTGVLELVSFVEREFGIAVDDDQLVPANFDSIAALSEFIRRENAFSPLERRDPRRSRDGPGSPERTGPLPWSSASPTTAPSSS